MNKNLAELDRMSLLSPLSVASYKEAMELLIYTLLNNASIKQPRGQAVHYIQNANFTILNPTTVAGTNSRPYNFNYLKQELELYLSGDTSVESFGHISKFWTKLANPDNKTINSNYGYRIFYKPIETKFDTSAKTQWDYAKQQLIKDKDTRQAVLFVSGQDVQFDNNNDFICTLNYTFDISNDKLNITVNRRSQDMFYGLPYDYAWEVYLLHRMHLELLDYYPNLQIGTYTLFCNNLHMYERNIEVFKNMLNDFKNKDTYTEHSLNDIFKLI